MGLNESTPKKTYASIKNGKVIVRVQEATEGAVTRVTETGKTIHEKMYDSITGQITSIDEKSTLYNGASIDTYEITLQDGIDFFNLSINKQSSAYNGFMSRIESVDLSLPVTFQPYYFEDKKRNVLVLLQAGKKIESNYSKDKPNGLPPMKQLTVKGKLIWDNTDQMVFFENLLKSKILPKLSNAQPKPVAAQITESDMVDGADDDLPF